MRTQDDVLEDTAYLLETCRIHEDIIPGLETWRTSLDTVLMEAQAKKHQAAYLAAEKTRATREWTTVW